MSVFSPAQLLKKPIRTLFLYGVTLIFLYQLWLLAHVVWYRSHAPHETAFMSARLAELRKTQPEAKLHRRWVDYSRISNHVKRAVVAAEDARFTEHNGFDWDGMQRAYNKNLSRGKIVAGGSTISQQLAKNLFLSPSRNPLRKAQEAVITVMLEQVLTKRRILEIYLNVIEWGERQYGVDAAARYYFGVSASALSPYQSARLAAMITNPRHYQRHQRSRGLASKTTTYQTRMRQVQVP